MKYLTAPVWQRFSDRAFVKRGDDAIAMWKSYPKHTLPRFAHVEQAVRVAVNPPAGSNPQTVYTLLDFAVTHIFMTLNCLGANVILAKFKLKNQQLEDMKRVLKQNTTTATAPNPHQQTQADLTPLATASSLNRPPSSAPTLTAHIAALIQLHVNEQLLQRLDLLV